MACKELVELITEYFEDALPAIDRSRFEARLTTCSGCTNYLDQMRRTIGLTGQLSEESIKPQARDELLNLFRDWKK